MATLSSTTDLSQYVGATVEVVNNSMTNSTTVQGKFGKLGVSGGPDISCLLYTSPSPRDRQKSRMPSSA